MLDASQESKRNRAHSVSKYTSDFLSETANQLRSAMRDAHVGLTLASIKVAKLAKVWDTEYKDKAGGLELGPWLIKEVHPTHKLARYMEMAAAAERVGKDLAVRAESRGLLWMHRQIPDDDALKAAIADVAKTYREQGSMPLTLSQVHRVCSRYSVKAQGREGMRSQLRAAKARIDRLCAQIVDLGKVPVD